MSFNKQLNWAVLGTGVIANEMAQALQNMVRTFGNAVIVNRVNEIQFVPFHPVPDLSISLCEFNQIPRKVNTSPRIMYRTCHAETVISQQIQTDTK